MTPDQLQAALVDHARRTKRKRHEVPSLPVDGEPLVFWAMPLSAADLGKYGAKLMAHASDVFVDILVDKAETEDGQKLFKPDAAKWLKPIVGTTALAEISEAFVGETPGVAQLVEDAEGNSGGTPSSEPS